MRPLARTLLTLCVLLSIAGVGAQTSPVETPLVLTITMHGRAGRLHVALRNRSTAPVHVFLGSADKKHQSLDNISLLFVDAGGKTIPIVPVGYAMNGNERVLNEVIAPGQEWNADIELTRFMVYDDPVNPAPVDHLPAGSYTVYGIYKGETYPPEPGDLPYWVGTIRSAPVQYVVTK
jgi:hypothetical protein